MKKFVPALVFFVLVLIIPAIIVLPFSLKKHSIPATQPAVADKPAASTPGADAGVEVAVYRVSKEQIDKVPLEDYLVGVVASEMPADFQPEALKAQALTARTYVVKQMMSGQGHPGLPKGAQVGDTTMDQVYSSEDQLRRIWGSEYDWRRKKILDAVKATSGQILTYNGEPIQATFFSTSNGYTENSEDYWPGSLPYLRSVPSPWDKNSPKFSSQQKFSVTVFETKLGIQSAAGNIIQRTAGKRVAKVNFNGKILTGKEIREKLGLNSSDFTWERNGNTIVVSTRGFGHGVGMSQYGANGMAAAGKTCADIVKHYYTGVQITSSQSMLAMITAGK